MSASKQRAAKEAKDREMEKRMKEVNWREMSFVGTELASMEPLYEEKFEFPDLVESLMTGELSDRSRTVYLFMTSEPVYLRGDEKLLNVPVVVAFASRVAPPSLVAHDSVQSTEASARALNALGGRPMPMRSVHLAWVPYVPQRMLGEFAPSPRVRPPVVVLSWESRDSRNRRMNEEQVHFIEYLNPYIVLPQVCDKLEKPDVRNVDFVFEHSGKQVQIVFDKDIDRLAEFIPDTIEKNALPDAARAPLEEAIRDAFKKARALADEQWKELQDKLLALTEDQRRGLLDARLIKFYPRHPDYDLRPYLSERVNRYFGNAAKVVGGDPAPKADREKAEPDEEEDRKEGKPAAKRSKK